MKLENRVAIVTGGAKGIGEGIAHELARDGAHIVLADIDKAGIDQVAADLVSDGHCAISVRTDVSDPASVAELISRATEEFDGIDIVVNNAAKFVYRGMHEATAEDIDTTFAVNVRGTFLVVKAAMTALAASEHASVINIASVHAVQNVGGTVPYAMSKGAIGALTRAMAIDLARDGVRVNAIAPGWVDTPQVRDIFASAQDPVAYRAQVEKRQLLGRLGTPADIGRAAVFLASEDASYITGTLLFVDSGMTAQLETWEA